MSLGKLGLVTSSMLVTYTFLLKFSLKVNTVPAVTAIVVALSSVNKEPPYDTILELAVILVPVTTAPINLLGFTPTKLPAVKVRVIPGAA